MTGERSAAEWIADEQADLWHDLDQVIRDAVNGTWSISADYVARRIIGAARLVGPTPTDGVPWTLVAGGVYEAVLLAGGMTPSMPDEAEWLRLEALMEQHGGGRAVNQRRYAATVQTIRSEGISS